MLDEFSQLLSRARGGDPDAMRRIAEQYEAKVRVVARVHLGPALRPYLDSQDLLQSVHRSLMVGLREDRFDISSPDKLIALTLTMVRRKIARQWRHLRRQDRLSGASHGSSNLALLLTSLSSPRQDPAAEAQFRDTVEHLCDNLDDVEQRIVDLRLQGYAAPEIGERLGLSAVNVRVRMTRLRQRLVSAGVMDDWL
ncbi:MAG: sigma-70 family RNA polymerase sigma factor [Planctomycetes bacterium]|nr:sigma-70 family RNA polymerase sigma factor [Planctomycetota bacterium]